MKRTIKLNESDLARIVEGTARRMLNELDWKTYANASKKAKARSDMGEDRYTSAVRDAYRRYSGNRHGTFPEEDIRRGYEDMKGRENGRAEAFGRASASAFNRDHLQGTPDDSAYWPSGSGFSRFYEDEPYKKHKKNDTRGDHTVQVRVNPYDDRYYVGMSTEPMTVDGEPDPDRYRDTYRFDWTPKGGLSGDIGYGRWRADEGDDSFTTSYMYDSYRDTPMFDRYFDAAEEIDDYADGFYRYEKGSGWAKQPRPEEEY